MPRRALRQEEYFVTGCLWWAHLGMQCAILLYRCLDRVSEELLFSIRNGDMDFDIRNVWRGTHEDLQIEGEAGEYKERLSDSVKTG